jgi:hypothetical protein
MRRIVLLALLSLGLPLLAFASTSASAAAHRGQPINAATMARFHERHGHTQFRGGQGTPGHTWAAYQREARRLRAYLHKVQVSRQRQALVSRWQGVADCESGGNWRINTGNGHYGGLQFNLSTWGNYGGSGMPNEAPAWRQSEVAERVRASSGLGAWPHCGSHYG